MWFHLDLLDIDGKVWNIALADGRASDLYEIIDSRHNGSDDHRRGDSSGGMAAHRAVERRLRKELNVKEASPPAESQAVVVRNFYSR